MQEEFENTENIIEEESAENIAEDSADSKKKEKIDKKNHKKEKVNLEEFKKCREDLENATEKITDLSDKILRLNAEFENFRKRVIRERDEIRTNTRIDAVESIVPILDHFDLALKAAENAKNIDAVLEGMNMIKTEFEKTLSSLGVEVINALGQQFDPNLHEAVANEPSEEFEKDTVVKQWRPGYKINSRLIRPATVVVSTGKSEE